MGGLIGFVIAIIRINQFKYFHGLCIAYVSFIRGTPLVIQLFLIYYGLPILLKLAGFGNLISEIHPIYFVYFTFSINAGAYLSETLRSAILSVHKGQNEAAYVIGLSKTQTMLSVILPQAMRVALPNLGNQFIVLLKETSLAFLVSVPEIMGQAKILAGRTSQFFEVYIAAAILYWCLCLLIERILRYGEKKLSAHI